MGDGLNMYASAANGRSDAITTRTNAALARRQAYADAYRLEADSEAALGMAGDNLMVMRRNQLEQVGEARSRSGASGFSASGGSSLVHEASVAEVLEMAVANAARDAAVTDANSRSQAAALRRQGDTMYDVGMVQADYQQRMARIANRTAPWAMLGNGLFTLGQLDLWGSGEGNAQKDRKA